MGQRTHLHTQLLAMLDQPHAGARLAERLQGESHVVSLLHARLGAQQEGLGSSAGLAGGTSRQLLAQQKFAATGVNSQVVAGLGGCSKADQLRLLVQTAIAEGNGGLGEQLAGMWRGAAGRSAILAASERRNQLEGGIQGRAGPAATAAAHRQTAVAVAQQRERRCRQLGLGRIAGACHTQRYEARSVGHRDDLLNAGGICYQVACIVGQACEGSQPKTCK